MLNPTQKLNPKIGQADIEQVPSRNGFGEGLLHLGEHDKNVVALTGDLAESTRILEFAKKYPERFIECGVAEQNMMGVAAGLALAGKTPFVASYATFSPGRSWDQLRVSVAYSKANVKVAGHHTGLSVGPDGATHQALEDIAIVRTLPNITVVVPCDTIEARKATIALGGTAGPAYLRLGREKTPVITTEDSPFSVGKASVLKEGSDVAIIGAGPILYSALQAALELEKQGLNVLVINNHTIKPIDVETIVWAAKMTGAVVTVEEHQKMGGVGSAIAEVLAQNHPIPIEMVGMPDSFGESGDPVQLLKKFGMDTEAIKEAIKKVLTRKN
ncbi:MAG TPA: transketolase C-terminal domain-containing protein [Patescibacteria group bacterium]|jgi:transketolase|nr:transketolase C-terminal domain-containing protein [Patescibacteria group bacterium]